MTHSPTLTLAALARALELTLLPESAATRLVRGVGNPATATAETLLFAETPQALAATLACPAAAVLTTEALAQQATGDRPLLLTHQPRLAFARAAQLLRPRPVATGIHPQAAVAPTAQLGADVSVGPFAVIEDDVQLGAGVRVEASAVVGAGCVIGARCHIYPRAVLYSGVVLGERVIVHAGAVLGADGFGYVRDRATGAYTQTPQQGRLVLEDDVEIGANTTVDRGALEETRIGQGTKLDNLVHVGHNVHIGANVVIAAQTGISGSSSIGKGAIVAGQVGIADHVQVGENAILGAQCGVPSHKQLEGPGIVFWGTPARPLNQYLKELATLARLTRAARKPKS